MTAVGGQTMSRLSGSSAQHAGTAGTHVAGGPSILASLCAFPLAFHRTCLRPEQTAVCRSQSPTTQRKHACAPKAPKLARQMNTRRGGSYTPAAETKDSRNAPPPFLTKT